MISKCNTGISFHDVVQNIFLNGRNVYKQEIPFA